MADAGRVGSRRANRVQLLLESDGGATGARRWPPPVSAPYTPAEFLATLADHVPDRYRHNCAVTLGCSRLASSARRTIRSSPWWARRGKPRRLRWSTSLQKCSGVDPLVDRNGMPGGSMGQLAAAIEVTWILQVVESSVPTTATFFPANSLDLSWSLNR